MFLARRETVIVDACCCWLSRSLDFPSSRISSLILKVVAQLNLAMKLERIAKEVGTLPGVVVSGQRRSSQAYLCHENIRDPGLDRHPEESGRRKVGCWGVSNFFGTSTGFLRARGLAFLRSHPSFLRSRFAFQEKPFLRILPLFLRTLPLFQRALLVFSKASMRFACSHSVSLK